MNLGSAIMRYHLASFVCAASVFGGCRTGGPDTSEAKLVGGTEALPHEYSSVLIWTSSDAALTRSYCTGTKISPRLILTAGHCVLLQDETPTPYKGRWRSIPQLEPGQLIKYSFERRLSPNVPQQKIHVRALHLPPAVRNCLSAEALLPACTGRIPTPDIAVIEVENETPFSEVASTEVDFDDVQRGDRVTIMGFGANDDASAGLPRLKFHRSEVASSNAIKEALVGTEADRDGLPDFKEFFGVLGYLTGANYANLGSGDSGGPVMRESPNGPHVIGINSDGFCPSGMPECQQTTNSLFQKLDKGAPHGVGEWLQSVMTQTGVE